MNEKPKCCLSIQRDIIQLKKKREHSDIDYIMDEPWGHSVCMLVTQLCLTLLDPMNCSPLGSSIHGFLQARILEWVAKPSSRGFPPLPLSPALQVDSLPTATWEALQNIILREISHNIQCIQRNSVLRAHPFVFKSNKVSLAQLAIYHCFIPCFWTSWAWNKDTALLYSIQHCKVPRSIATSRAFDSVCQMHEWLIPYMIGLANPPSHLWNFSTWSFFCREPLTVQILCASTYRWRLVYRHTLFYCSLLHFFFFFCKLKVCGHPVPSKSTGIIFPTAFAYFMSLGHILVILRLFQTFSLLLYLFWWFVISGLWYYYYNSLKAQMVVNIVF